MDANLGTQSLVAVDGYFCDDERTGMGVVLYGLLRELSTLSIGFRIVVLVPDRSNYTDLGRLEGECLKVVPLRRLPFPVWEQYELRRWASRYRPDLMWFPYNTAPLRMRRRSVVTIHDLIYLEGSVFDPPTLYKRLGKAYRRAVVPRTAGQMNRVMTVSHFSAARIESELHIPEQRIDVVRPGWRSASGLGGGHSNHNHSSETGSAFGAEGAFILAAGSLEPRKNVLRLLESYRTCVASDPAFPSLVLYGFRGYKGSDIARRITELGLGHRVHVLPFVAEETKNRLYAEAEFFVFPSLNEGFGVPVIEAFAAGCPVITSNKGALEEVAGDSAMYADPDSERSIAQSMIRLHSDPSLRTDLARKGLKRSDDFSWDAAGRCAKRSLDAALNS